MRSKKVRRVLGVKANWRLFVAYCVYLLLTWGLFRFTIKLEDAVEELVVKPLVWLGPLLLVFLTDKRRLRLFDGSYRLALVWGGGVGVVYLVVNMIVALSLGKSWSLSGAFWDFVGVSLATAIVEEIVFSGFVFGSVWAWTRRPGLAFLVGAGLFALINLPIGLFVYRYGGANLGFFISMAVLVSLMDSYVFFRTRNILAPILSHWMWGVAIVLFR